MYERVWEGTAPGLDGAEWDLFLDFNQDTGLFRVGGSLDGEHREMWECADPVVSGLMARSETDRPDDPYIMALVPPAPLEMQGRFAPFSSPDQIVAGTWRTPRDWPEARKDETVNELRMRRVDIMSTTNGLLDILESEAVEKCSRLLNGMYGDPSHWPRHAVDVVLDYPRGIKLGDKYHDVYGFTLPPEFSAAVVRAGSAWKGEDLDYRDAVDYRHAVFALLEKAKSEGMYVERDWEDHFGVIPSVDATQFVRELSEGDTVTLSLAANFNSFGGSTVELGDVRVDFKLAAFYRSLFKDYEFHHGNLNVQNLGKLPLDEFCCYLGNCCNWHLYEGWRGAFLDREYGVDLEGEADRVLISMKIIDESRWLDEGLDEDDFSDAGDCAWKVVSWSKAEGVYHAETWTAYHYLPIGSSGTDYALKKWDETFESFPSEFMPDMSAMPIKMDGRYSTEFLNARYAYDPDRLLKGHARKDNQVKSVPGTKSLKEKLSKLVRKANVNRAQGNGNRGHHV